MANDPREWSRSAGSGQRCRVRDALGANRQCNGGDCWGIAANNHHRERSLCGGVPVVRDGNGEGKTSRFSWRATQGATLLTQVNALWQAAGKHVQVIRRRSTGDLDGG